MSTFVESYDFSGKTLAAFCTSASSGFGSSDSLLKEATDSAIWLDGHRFSAGVSEEDVMLHVEQFFRIGKKLFHIAKRSAARTWALRAVAAALSVYGMVFALETRKLEKMETGASNQV